MAPDVVLRKLEALRDAVQRIEARCPVTLDALLADRDAQDVLVLNLARAVQSCVDIGVHLLAESGETPPSTMNEVFDRLERAGRLSSGLAARLRPAVGFRNVVIHRYDDIDWGTALQVRNERLRDFAAFAAEMRPTTHPPAGRN